MKIKNLLLVGFMAVCGVAGALVAPVQNVMAVTCPAGSKYPNDAKTYADCNVRSDAGNDASTVMTRVNTAINVVLGVVGVVAVAMIILGGIQYATSQGDAAKAAKARNTILFSIIGLFIALLAFAIVNFVLSNVF